MAITTTTRKTHGNMTVSEVDVTEPVMRGSFQIGTVNRPGWNVDCDLCGEPVATLLDVELDAAAVAALGHECETSPCGCPVHIITDEGHQEGCDEADE